MNYPEYGKEEASESFGTAILVWWAKRVKFDRVCRTFVVLNLGSTNGAPSESNVAPVSLQVELIQLTLGSAHKK